VLATGTFSSSSGEFSITLPMMKNSALRPFDMPNTVTLSDDAVRQTHVNYLEAFDNSGKNVGRLVCYAEGEHVFPVISSFIYVDRECLVTGTISSDTNDDGNSETLTYNASLKAGWNILYATNNGSRITGFTTTKPAA
jgi:hypothetical protein